MVTGMSNLIQSNTMPAPSATTIETPPSTARRVSDNRRVSTIYIMTIILIGN